MAAMLVVIATVGSGHSAAADNNSGLPMFSACGQQAPPELPPRWHAVGLMLPFVRDQLTVGEFVYDSSTAAMRATLYGVESGAVDLLITPEQTYQLRGPADSPNACIALGRKYDLPGTRWLPDEARCDGEAPVGTKTAQWWKTPAADGRRQSQWYATDTKLPWRVMFPSRSAVPAVIGDYGITYFTKFTPVAQTNLASLRNLCAAQVSQPSAAAAAAATAQDLMAINKDISEDERAKRVQALVPGLSHQACSSLRPARWPNHFVMSAILSPVPAKWTPLPSMIYYDWEGAGTFFEYMYHAQSSPPAVELVSVLKKGIGYSIESLPNGAMACAATSPGVVRPDWMEVAGCDCKAVIDHNPDLGPDMVSQIRACPVMGEGLHVNWSWYTTEGRPILFAEPDAIGMGLNVADYDRWLPDASMPAEAFELPQLCTRPEQAGLPPVGNGPPPEANAHCAACHTLRH